MKPLHNTSSVGMTMTRLRYLLKWHDYLCACNMRLQLLATAQKTSDKPVVD
jgi:hypothetical protein